ncbi:MAG: MBL fold metallo-hydrolase [Bacillota bacterium]
MLITMHRGSQEIGGSCVELQSNDDRIIIDLGIPLINKNGIAFDLNKRNGLYGSELVDARVLPNIHGLYRWDESYPKVKGLIVSHSHMDHCGFISHVHPEVPVFAGEATHRLLELNALFTPFEGITGTKATYTNHKTFNCGRFRITPYLVDHSAFDAYAFLVESDGKKLLYSGDFRNHGRKGYAFTEMLKALSSKRIDALLLEGTMLGRNIEETETEDDLEQRTFNLLQGNDVLALIYVSAHNIDRLVTFYRSAKRCNRLMVVDLYTANVLNELKDFASIPYPSQDYEYLKVFYPKALTDRTVKEGNSDKVYCFKQYKITRKQIVDKQKELIMMVRPSMLNDLKKLNILPGAKFIYSMWAGLKEEEGVTKLMDFAKNKKMDIHYIHSSGHATLETLKEFVNALQPNIVIPIHTLNPEGYNVINSSVKRLSDGETYAL